MNTETLLYHYESPRAYSTTTLWCDKIIEAMRLEPAKITRNPNALLMQTRHEDKYQLADDIKKDFKEEIEVDSGVAHLIF
ncbi:MAG: hypothetical protein ACLS36_00500 [Streptococcus sp.]